MPISFEFSYVASDDLTVVYELFGSDLVLSPMQDVVTADQLVMSGSVDRITLSFDFNDDLNALGQDDFLAFDARYDGVDVSEITEDPATVQLYFFGAVSALGAAYGELDSENRSGLVYSDGFGTSLLSGTKLNDHITVGGDGRVVTARGGDDVVRVEDGSGDMVIVMGNGNDRAYGADGDDRIVGGTGDDRLYAGSGSDRLAGGTGNDVMNGCLGDDVLFGGSGNDVLIGQAGRDLLFGGTGTDVLVSEGDGDRMLGGADSDAFVFILGGPEQEDGFSASIRDFEQGEDMLWMSGTGNSTHSAQDAYDLFQDHAVQRGDHVILRDGDWRLVILNADLSDFNVDDFMDGGESGGFYQWADTIA